MVQENLHSGELVEVLSRAASNVGNLYVVYPSRRFVPNAVALFVEMAEKRLMDLLSMPSKIEPPLLGQRC